MLALTFSDPPNPVSFDDGEKRHQKLVWMENQQSFNFENIYKRYVSYLKNNKFYKSTYLKNKGKRVYSWR